MNALSMLTFVPRAMRRAVRTTRAAAAGFSFARRWTAREQPPVPEDLRAQTIANNPLRSWFEAHQTGRGAWKWEHYFDIYHRHFAKFVGRDAQLVEIGVYSGGSLDMWKSYLGSRAMIHGVDIEDACRVYSGDQLRIHIGDQADREFWRKFKQEVPLLDIVVDDGGHVPQQQIVTLEELLPHLRPGGVYLCEDVHGAQNVFAAFVSGIANHFNVTDSTWKLPVVASPTAFQRDVYSIHLYPFVVVIERAEEPALQFTAPKHGTEWQPFLDRRPPRDWQARLQGHA